MKTWKSMENRFTTKLVFIFHVTQAEIIIETRNIYQIHNILAIAKGDLNL